MIGPVPTLLVAQGAIFLCWALLAFRILFHLRRRAQDRSGHIISGPVTFVEVTRDWLADPEEARPRFWFYALTVLFVVATIALALKGR